ncbi:MAG: diguanylate cyclase [Candidatus Thiodiazotropha sp. (ex Lucinoma kastoroae)]|nr:diguanylate cyclase [Candidatus Thiodiazotropha sp. (ex Lucinoma kastoroae)]
MPVITGNEQGDILVVDDTLANVKVLVSLLEKAGYGVRATTSGAAALRICSKRPPDLLLLDIMMSEMDGYEVCLRLKADENTRKIPVMFISALDNPEAIIKGFKSGGVDYINKPFNAVEVLARVNVHIHLEMVKRQLREKNLELEQQIATDSLTGLYSRRYFIGELKQCCSKLRHFDTPFCLVMLDLDHFRQVNDRFGHEAGDQVLRTVSERIQGCLREVDFAARWGEEEFVILAPNTTREEIGLLIERLQEKISSTPIESVASVTASYGVVCPVREGSPDALIKRVEQATHTARTAGQNCVEFAQGGKAHC